MDSVLGRSESHLSTKKHCTLHHSHVKSETVNINMSRVLQAAIFVMSPCTLPFFCEVYLYMFGSS